ncbi:hypothetical protein V1505DRAFT_356074 [Lipomyces doorenjongii]
MLPRFKPENFDQNLKLVDAVGQIAKRERDHRAGAHRLEARIIENCMPASLIDEDKTEIQKILDTLPISRERYGGQHESMLNG